MMLARLALQVVLADPISALAGSDQVLVQRQDPYQPTGTLLRPLNGTSYGYTENLFIQYQPIYIEDISDVNLPQYFTDSIDVFLHGLDYGGNFPLANGLTAFKQGLGAEAAIEARFHLADANIPPGNYEIIVKENAIHYDTVALPAPTVSPLKTISIGSPPTPAPYPPRKREPAVEKRDGPSGSVIIPTGGTTYSYLPGSINLVYQPAVYYTSSVTVQLYSLDTGSTTMLANGLTSDLFSYSPTLPIIGHWTTFDRPCGDYQLIIYERQSDEFGNDRVMPFRSAAPYVHVNCTTYNPSPGA